MDGSKVEAQGYVSFWLWCGQYNSEVIACVFRNMHRQLILGIPGLKQYNPRINWRLCQINVEKNGKSVFLH